MYLVRGGDIKKNIIMNTIITIRASKQSYLYPGYSRGHLIFGLLKICTLAKSVLLYPNFANCVSQRSLQKRGLWNWSQPPIIAWLSWRLRLLFLTSPYLSFFDRLISVITSGSQVIIPPTFCWSNLNISPQSSSPAHFLAGNKIQFWAWLPIRNWFSFSWFL